MEQLIKQLGLFGYIRQYPVNPITMVGGVLLIGIVVLIINAAVRKRSADKFAGKTPGAAIMVLHVRELGNQDYAENIRIQTLNGSPAHWFFLKPGIVALYLTPGENRLQLYADWARQHGKTIKMFQSNQTTISVTAHADGHYALEYCISEDKFIFSPYQNERIFGQ